MEFRLDEGQLELQGTVDRFCANRFPVDTIATREGGPVDRAGWAEMAGLGIFGLLLPEDAGGIGLGAVEAALVFEQLGSHLVPGPLLWTLLFAPYVDGATDGTTLVGAALAADIRDGAALVEHAGDVDVIVVVHDGELVLHRAADLEPVALDPFDPLTPMGRVELRGGERIAGADKAQEARRLGTVLSAAMLAGISSRALEVARTYALEREQFDVVIGSFQAVKHMLADMYVRSMLAQSAVYAAAALVDDPSGGDATQAASGAKLLAAESAITNASAAVQVLGGMGFTWDMLPNYLLKRAWVLEHTFGTAEEQALAIGSNLLSSAR